MLPVAPGARDGVWIGAVAYDATPRFEPASPVPTSPGEPRGPLAVWHRVQPAAGRAEPLGPWRASALSSATGRARFLADVRRALDFIRAGDVYQVNLTHRLEARFEGDPRAFAADLVTRADPAHGVYVEHPAIGGSPAGVVVSVSPERFLSFDARTRRVRTQPMKGTRPIAGDPRELMRAPKDRAELAMIVDLMRNDLGRVCEPGLVRVDQARRVDAHAGSVWQATADISGTVRTGIGAADLLGAAFPPGSVTGAPKVRATQIIAELEPVARGFYCGAAGVIEPDGSLDLNVAIRTAHLVALDEHAPDEPPRPGRYALRFSVGAGIVADSDPDAEWAETMDKAGVLMSVLSTNPAASFA